MNFTVAVQIITFFVEHKEDIAKMILGLESLLGAVAGPDKAAAFKTSIATALGIEDKIEQAWPLVSPVFNLIVSSVKVSKSEEAATAAGPAVK